MEKMEEKYELIMQYLVQEGMCPSSIGIDIHCLDQELNGKMEDGFEVGSCGHCWYVRVINELKNRKQLLYR
jgi:hypothetical protein